VGIYFDNAATSHPKPDCVLRAVRRAMTGCNANPGRSGHAAALAAGRLVLDARERLAAQQTQMEDADTTQEESV